MLDLHFSLKHRTELTGHLLLHCSVCYSELSARRCVRSHPNALTKDCRVQLRKLILNLIPRKLGVRKGEAGQRESLKSWTSFKTQMTVFSIRLGKRSE